MKFLKVLWRWITSWVTLKPLRIARQRKLYDELKKLIVEEHHKGFGGFVLPRKFARSKSVLDCFPPPMYYFAKGRTKKGMQLCIFWQKQMMDKEVGPPAKEVLDAKKEQIDQAAKVIQDAMVEQMKQGLDLKKPGVEYTLGVPPAAGDKGTA